VKIPLGSSHLSRQEKAEVSEITPRTIIENATSIEDAKQPAKTVRHRSKSRILVVDDDSEIRDYLTDYFAAYYKVDTVSDGESAWKYILDNGADLVISDVNMPGMNGIQLLKNIKNNGNTNHIPVILLTSKTEYTDRKEGWEKGADAYVAKPFSGEELMAISDSLIENRIMLKGRFSGAQSQEDKIDKIEIKSNDEVLMNKIVEMINAHIDDPNLNVEMLGHEVGISRAHLHRKMKDMIGVSPSDFIRNIRLRKACELLKNTDNDVTQIAYNIGFTSQTHFSTAFKKFTGVSPSEYRTR
jgi:YesN/AraC family two-component response regulator